MPIDLGCALVQASCADPYVAMLAEDGQVVLLTLRETRGTARLHLQPANLMFRPQIETICLYRDVSGLFTTFLSDENEEESVMSNPVPEAATVDAVDNEDELLYGDVPAFKMPLPQKPKPSDTTKKAPWWQKCYNVQDIKPSYWLFAYRESGVLEVYSLPDLRLSYLVKNSGFGQSVLHDSMESTTVSLFTNKYV